MRDKKIDLESRINRLERQNALLKKFMICCFAVALIPYLMGISQTQPPTETEMRGYLKIPDVIKTKELRIIGENNINAIILKAESERPSISMVGKRPYISLLGDQPYVSLMGLDSKYVWRIGHDDTGASARLTDLEKNKDRISFGVDISKESSFVLLSDRQGSPRASIGVIGEGAVIGIGKVEKSAKIIASVVDDIPSLVMFNKSDEVVWRQPERKPK